MDWEKRLRAFFGARGASFDEWENWDRRNYAKARFARADSISDSDIQAFLEETAPPRSYATDFHSLRAKQGWSMGALFAWYQATGYENEAGWIKEGERRSKVEVERRKEVDRREAAESICPSELLGREPELLDALAAIGMQLRPKNFHRDPKALKDGSKTFTFLARELHEDAPAGDLTVWLRKHALPRLAAWKGDAGPDEAWFLGTWARCAGYATGELPTTRSTKH